MSVSDLIEQLELLGVELWCEDGALRFRAPQDAFTPELRAQVREHKTEIMAELQRRTGPAPTADAEHEPFPLTDVQAAYLVGRTSSYDHGGTGCHGYAEFDVAGGATAARIRSAWTRVVACHDMMKVRVSPDGWQQIDATAAPLIDVVECSDSARFELTLREMRPRLRDTDYRIGDAPMIRACAVIGPDTTRLLLSVDLLMTDFRGLTVLCSDLARGITDPDWTPARPATSFRTATVAEAERREGIAARRKRESALAHWRDRLPTLPDPLQLPHDPRRTDDPAPMANSRRCHRIAAESWTRFTRCASTHGVTPSAVFLGVLGRLGRRYADRDASLITVTVLDRPDYPGIDRVVGDFTTTVVAAAPGESGLSMVELARRAQADLFDSLDHAAVSGIEVGRMLAEERGWQGTTSPVVLTSTVGFAGEEESTDDVLAAIPELGLSRTPQVELDVQVSPFRGGVCLVWDSRDGLVPEEILDHAFADFVAAVEKLGRDETAWYQDPLDRTPLPPTPERAARHSTLLHPILEAARRGPDETAVICAGRTTTRAELLRQAAAYARFLRDAGCRRGDAVVVRFAPSTAQTAAMLGALSIGACYVPVEVDWPEQRCQAVEETLQAAGLRSYRLDADVTAPPGPEPLVVDAAPDDRAYIIFTSGSTGTPKGVVITHRQARTTLDAIDDLLDLQPRDRALAVSRGSFDLSVFNIFGMLGAGGAVVIPQAGTAADGQSWLHDICEYGVTVWNSVPAQYSILLDAAEKAGAAAGGPALDGLRAVLVSGDWVPVDQPGRSRRCAPAARFFALGGATEASIWSNCFEVVGEVPAGWRSVPYGKALPGQGMYVLNADLEPAAVWQVGQICILGGGVADGYLGQENPAFGIHPDTGERRYLTGDLGRLLPSGDIEFLGRADNQVKIAGHRIELGEIEAVLGGAADVRTAVATVVDDSYIAAAVVPEPAAKGHVPLEGVARALSRVEEEQAATVDAEAFGAFLEQMESVARQAMRWTRDHSDSTGHRELMQRWDRHLAQYPNDPQPPSYETVLARWQQVRRAGHALGYGDEQLAYVEACLVNLSQVMSGEVDPLALLFPEGRLDVAQAAYGDNLTARYLNGLVAAAIACRAEECGHRLRILEIGGGVGATTAPVLAALADRDIDDIDYVFTDVSAFFLDAAARRWDGRVTTQIFDLNRPAHEQGLAPGSFDIVLAANVLHNAKNIPRALQELHELLTPDGALAIIDATRPNAPLMVSMEFKEGLTDFDDSRATTAAAFLDRDQWIAALEDSPFARSLIHPAAGSPMEPIAQSMMWAQADGAACRLDIDEIVQHARELLPTYMIPGELFCLREVPATANGKIDRSRVASIARGLRSGADKRTGRSTGNDRRTLTERQLAVAQVWAEVLSLPDPHALDPADSFFALGGDSLLLARCVGRLRATLPEAQDIAWDDAMRRMVADPSLEGTAAAFAPPDPTGPVAGPAAVEGCLVDIAPARGDADRSELVVLVHDGSGDLGPYEDLIGRLTALDHHPAIVGVRRTPDDGYYQSRPEELFDMLADRYVAALPAHSRVHLVGYCMGALIAISMADRLASAGTDVASVTVISSYRIPFHIEDPVLLDYAFARLMRREPSDLGLGFDDRELAELIDLARDRHDDHIPEGALTELAAPHQYPSCARILRNAPPHSEERLRLLADSDPRRQWTAADLAELRNAYATSLRAVAHYDHPGYLGDITFLRQHGDLQFLPTLSADMTDYWRQLCLGELVVHNIEGTHFDCLTEHRATRVATLIADHWGDQRCAS